MAASNEPHDLATYRAFQEVLDNHRQAPSGGETFEQLRESDSAFVFRDFTPFLKDVFGEGKNGGCCLIRGRRWGKTTFGAAWLAYMRCDRDLFVGTAIENDLPLQPKIGVSWDFTKSAGLVGRLANVLDNAVLAGVAHAKARGHSIPEWNFQLEKSDPLDQITQILIAMESYALRAKLKFALFIDEYDFFVNSEKSSDEVERLTGFFYRLFSALKGHAAETIPNQFITGTSRLALKQFFSGPNAIRDISFDGGMAQALGYTWEQIEALFPTQLTWLERVKQLSRAELKDKLTRWFDRHRWSPDSQVHVFNPYSIHQFMIMGLFTAHWAESGSNSAFLQSKPLMQNLLQSLMDTYGAPPRISIKFSALKNTKMPEKDQPISEDTQIALLVGTGILAIHSEEKSSSQGTIDEDEDQDVFLVVPNLDAATACQRLLSTALHLPPTISKQVIGKLLDKMDIAGLFKLIASSGALKVLITNMIDEGDHPSEKVVSAAFAFLMQMHLPARVSYRYERKVTTQVPSTKKTRLRGGHAIQTFRTDVLGEADHVLHLKSKRLTIVFEFKMKSSRGKSWARQLEKALKQLLIYTAIQKEGFGWLGVVVIFDDPPYTVEIQTKPLTENEITRAYGEAQRFRQEHSNCASTLKAEGLAAILQPLLEDTAHLASVAAASSSSCHDD